MSIVPRENIEVIAQSVGINHLSQDGALALARDVEYRIREIMQEAIKCMRHSRKTKLTTDDVDTALSVRNVEPVYGFASGDPLRFKRASGHKDLFYIDDKDIDFKDVIEAPLPKVPLDTSIMCHWLAIDGVQPAIPENAPVTVISPPDNKNPENKSEEHPVDIKLPIKHVLSRELQLYFDKVTELVVNSSETALFKQALASLATDPGLHPLVPYFTCFIADEVSRGLVDFRLLVALMRLVRSLLRNPHIHMERYLHQLMPSVVTCLVAKRLGNRFADNHWNLRDFTAKLVASICKRFGHVYSNLQPRLTKTLINAFLDPKRSITQHYGAIQGLTALGPNVVRLLILPNLEPYMRLLEPEMHIETQKNEAKRKEADTEKKERKKERKREKMTKEVSEEGGHGKDYVDPPPAPLFDLGELKLWSFYRALIAEYIATLLFLYVTVATVIGHKKQTGPCDGVGLLGIAWSFGGMIFVLVYCTAGISGGHINPAVTFGLFLARKVSLVRAVAYMVAQCLGAISGVGLVKAFMKHSYNSLGGGANSVSHGYTKGTALGAEIIGTFVLVYTVFSATDPKRSARDSHVPVLAPLPIGFAVFMVHLATIPITGTGINPARSFGAAVIYNNGKVWDDQWIFWVGPFVGALAAAAYHQYILRAAAIKALGSFRSNATN